MIQVIINTNQDKHDAKTVKENAKKPKKSMIKLK